MAPANIENGQVDSKSKAHGRRKVIKSSLSRIEQISNILLLDRSRIKGLIFSTNEISVLSKEKFIANCIKWMQICCNAEDLCDTSPALKNLETLIERASCYPELNASVSHLLRVKFFGKFFKHFLHFDKGWKCVELCITHYKGSCNAYHERLKNAATCEIEKNIISPSVARVYALLPDIGECGNEGINSTNKWKSQFEDILLKCNSILHDLFVDVVESQAYDDNAYQAYCSAKNIDELYLQKLFHNYCSVLQFMLMCSFSARKDISPQKVFDVVCRCLNVTNKTLGNLDTTQKIRLANSLPQFHFIAINLLKTLIATCKTNLLPYSFLITKVLNQIIQSTKTDSSDPLYYSYLRLKLSVYETWRKWVLASYGAGALDSHTLAVSALNEISEDENSKTEATEIGTHDREIHHPLQIPLCILALKVLQVYVREVGATLSSDQIKAIQVCVVKKVLHIQRTTPLTLPYSFSACRYELYSLLLDLVNCQNSKWASPVNWAVDLFKQGLNDSASEISSLCSSSLRNVQNIIDQEIIRVPSIEETTE